MRQPSQSDNLIKLNDGRWLKRYHATDGRCSTENYTLLDEDGNFLKLFSDTDTYKGRPDELKALLLLQVPKHL